MFKERIIKCFDNLGLIVDESEDNFYIDEYIQDSVLFISLIIELENEFDIEIPDDYLLADTFKTYTEMKTMIDELVTI